MPRVFSFAAAIAVSSWLAVTARAALIEIPLPGLVGNYPDYAVPGNPRDSYALPEGVTIVEAHLHLTGTAFAGTVNGVTDPVAIGEDPPPPVVYRNFGSIGGFVPYGDLRSLRTDSTDLTDDGEFTIDLTFRFDTGGLFAGPISPPLSRWQGSPPDPEGLEHLLDSSTIYLIYQPDIFPTGIGYNTFPAWNISSATLFVETAPAPEPGSGLALAALAPPIFRRRRALLRATPAR